MTRRGGLVVAGVVVLLAAVVGVALARRDDPGLPGPTPLTVTWEESEGHPGCVYDPATATVRARLRLDGTAPADGEATVTVTAYRDENTSRPVGSVTRSVAVTGTVHRALALTVPVSRPPQVGEDGVAACSQALAR